MDIKKTIMFLDAAGKGIGRGESKEFTCPLCNGVARASKASNNGHLHAGCEKCGFRVMQ